MHSFSQTGKVVEELLELKYLYLLILELNGENIKSRCFDLWTGRLFNIFYLSCSKKGMPLLYIKTLLLYWHQVLIKQEPLNVAC